MTLLFDDPVAGGDPHPTTRSTLWDGDRGPAHPNSPRVGGRAQQRHHADHPEQRARQQG